MTTIETLHSGLESLVELTGLLSGAIAGNEPVVLADLSARRAGLLDNLGKLMDEWMCANASEADRQVAFDRLKPVIERVREADRKLVDACEHKKQEISEKLRQATNNKRLLAYSR